MGCEDEFMEFKLEDASVIVLQTETARVSLCQKRPIPVSKEAYKDLAVIVLQTARVSLCQKRLILVSKEAYTGVKRGLY